MIKQLCILISLALPALLPAQVTINNQKPEAGRKSPDTSFVSYLMEKASAYSKSIAKNDSAEPLWTEAIVVSEKTGYSSGLLTARAELAQYYFQKGKLSLSLNPLLKNNGTAIQVGDRAALFNNLRLMIDIYMKIMDMDMLRADLSQRQFILDHRGIKDLTDTGHYVLSQYNSLALYYSLENEESQFTITLLLN